METFIIGVPKTRVNVVGNAERYSDIQDAMAATYHAVSITAESYKDALAKFTKLHFTDFNPLDIQTVRS